MIFRTARGLAAALVCLSFSYAACAATSVSTDSSLEDVTVTATRIAMPVADTVASVTVLTRSDIELRQALSLQELFAGEAGMQISNNGGPGKLTSVFLRGMNSDQVLVLVDGVRMGSVSAGLTPFQYLPIDQIERVEIVRGPLSSLYGSEAMGGVIQLFTQRPTEEGVFVRGNASAGSHSTYDLHAGVDGLEGPWSFGLSAGNLTSNGYRSCRGAGPSAALPFGAGCYVDDPSADGFHDVSSSAHLGYRFSEAADLEASILRSQGGTRYDGSYTNHEAFVEQAVSLSGHWSPVAPLRLTAQLGQSHDNELDTLDRLVIPGNLFDSIRNNASLQADWTFAPRNVATLGVDYVRDRLDTDAGFPVTSRKVTGVYGEYQASFGANDLTFSGRRDDNSQFGSKTTGSVGWGYHLTPTLRATASYGTAFHAPTFNDLYYPYFGNPLLRPERSRSVEIGLDQRLEVAHWALRGFDTRVHDLIAYDAAFFAPENTDEARIRGVELEGGGVVGEWTAAATASVLDARNVTPGAADYDDRLPRRARASGRLEVARGWQQARLAARFNVSGSRYDDAANTALLGGYSTLDLLAQWNFAARWTLQAKLANATDRRYETALYYPQDRRNFLITLRYGPDTRMR